MMTVMTESPRANRRSLPVYTISIAARLTEIPVHTIRWLETNGLVEPARTEGRQRLFSETDIEFLLEIADLLDRKVNLAGIRVILEIKRTYNLGRIAQ